MSKDLTKLSRKELETKLRKKYGVEKYLNQRSQLLSLLGMKGETDIETGFTGPETEALSIMFENVNKAEGGIISLAVGSGGIGSEDDDDYSGSGPSADETGSANEGDMSSGSGGDDFSDEDYDKDDSVFSDVDKGLQAFGGRGGAYSTPSTAGYQGFGPDDIEQISKEMERNPQLQGFLGKRMQSLLKDNRVRDVERDKDGRITGVTAYGPAFGIPGLPQVATYTGYGKGMGINNDSFGDNDDPEVSEKIKKIVEEREDTPLTEAELDYYARGMGTATKPLKSLEDVNAYMAGLVSPTASPAGAKLSKDKKFLILPNGKIINLKTGKVQESMSGLELFAGGMI